MLRLHIQYFGSFFGVDGNPNQKVFCSFKGTLKYLAIDFWKAKELKNIKMVIKAMIAINIDSLVKVAKCPQNYQITMFQTKIGNKYAKLGVSGY